LRILLTEVCSTLLSIISISNGLIKIRLLSFSTFSKPLTEGIEVLPQLTIYIASAKQIAGKIKLLLESEIIALVTIPKREFPSKN